MKCPTVSILLLTWNRAPYLKICLEKMFAALSPNVSREIILMDNCSDDDTCGILNKYKDFPDVRIVRNPYNMRLNAYKKLFAMATGRYIIEVDDDILDFPAAFDNILVEYITKYTDYGYLALNVIQNEKTNGAKPAADRYHDDSRGDMVVQEGPTGGWCTIFRRWHYAVLRPILSIHKFSMQKTEDGAISGWIARLFRKRIGIIKNHACLHAVGPAYAREYGLLAREREKYVAGGRADLANAFRE